MKNNVIRGITTLLTIILTAALGRIQYSNHTETWYNLPMQKVIDNAEANGITGEYWERADGCKMIGHFIICAGAQDRYGEVVETSRGLGIVIDTGDFAKTNPTAIDMAVTW